MANEAVCLRAPTKFTDYTCADNVTIEKGTLLKLSGDHTAAASSTTDIFAGICWIEKVAGDGRTRLNAALDGEWDITACTDAVKGVISGGSLVALSGANLIATAIEADLVNGRIVGKALETSSASEVIRVRVGGWA